MSIETFPAIIPNSTELGIIWNTKTFVSPLSGYTQTVSREGARWLLRMVFNGLQDSERGVLKGFIAFMEGQVNRAEIEDHSYVGARGALGGTPLIDGASQTGSSIDLKGLTNSVTGWIKAGDLFSYSNGTNKELKMCTSDSNSNGSGLITIPCAPEIHTSPADGAAVETTTPVGTFMLASKDFRWSNVPGQVAGAASPMSNFSLEWVEDIL